MRVLAAAGASPAAVKEVFEHFSGGKGTISYRELNRQLRSGVDLPLHPSLRVGAAGPIRMGTQNKIPARKAPTRPVGAYDGARTGGLVAPVLAPVTLRAHP